MAAGSGSEVPRQKSEDKDVNSRGTSQRILTKGQSDVIHLQNMQDDDGG